MWGQIKSRLRFQLLEMKQGFGRVPSGRAIRCKSSLVPRCGLSTSIPHAEKHRLKNHQFHKQDNL